MNRKPIDIMDAITRGAERRDHRIVILEPGEELSDAICDQMEADGYVFDHSPAADETGKRKVYFVPRDEP
jgi:hypothetical protein